MLTIRRAHKPDQIEEVAQEAVADLLKTGDSSLWFHLDSPTQEELSFLEKELKIHPLTIEDILKQNQRPKIECFENYVYLALHPLATRNKLEIVPSELDLVLGKQWLVSSHYGALPGVIEGSSVHERLTNALPHGADFLLYTIVDLVVDGYFPILDVIEEEIEDLEDYLLTRVQPEDMKRLLYLKRSLIRVRHAVTPQREVFNELTRHDLPFIGAQHALYFRDVYDHLIVVVEELDSLREILSGALEIHLASMSNQLNVTIKRLTAWGTIFVVITAITGIYGMNFEHMPELQWRYGYPAVLIAMAAISIGLYAYFKKKDYL
ncbi:MAG TPA: magnesium/cobalt transporter CorA [Candidatus Binatia bacterium]|jgi:magnesium transporter|nr:magnesium/cobalt transporter CorA [Candidatus Binatia bacterium]